MADDPCLPIPDATAAWAGPLLAHDHSPAELARLARHLAECFPTRMQAHLDHAMSPAHMLQGHDTSSRQQLDALAEPIIEIRRRAVLIDQSLVDEVPTLATIRYRVFECEGAEIELIPRGAFDHLKAGERWRRIAPELEALASRLEKPEAAAAGAVASVITMR